MWLIYLCSSHTFELNIKALTSVIVVFTINNTTIIILLSYIYIY